MVLGNSLLILCTILCIAQAQRYFVECVNGSWSVTEGMGSGVAFALYEKTLNTTGWDVLLISTDGTQDPLTQAFGAGYLEGYVTQESIWNSFLVFQQTNDLSNQKLADFVTRQMNWLRVMVKAEGKSSDYWGQVGLVLQQLDGLIAGYNAVAPANQQITLIQQYYFQWQTELDDIMTYIKLVDGTLDPDNLPIKKFNTHCSVLVKVSKNETNLIAAHDTWTSYNQMLREYKYYNLNFNTERSIPFVAFSSYPGVLQSTDDFYLTQSQLFVAETTNDVMNGTLFLENISPLTVPEWIRVIIANSLATSGIEWSFYFGLFNSGTYNNQWQIVDYKLFTPGMPLVPDTLWIVEQIPGNIVAADKTDVLIQQGFWPSYNVPYFEEIYNLSGYPAYFEKYGNAYSYSECARAQIFRRDAPAVQTMDDMKRIMRYNEFQTDPLSLQDACRGISARCDLNTPWTKDSLNGFVAFGGIDSKITDETMIKTLTSHAVSGPTWDSQPPFAWTNLWKDVPHYGMPTVFDFSYVEMTPRSFPIHLKK